MHFTAKRVKFCMIDSMKHQCCPCLLEIHDEVCAMLPFVCQSLNWDKTVGIHSSDYINVVWTWYGKRLKTTKCMCVSLDSVHKYAHSLCQYIFVFSVLDYLDHPHFVLLIYKLC